MVVWLVAALVALACAVFSIPTIPYTATALDVASLIASSYIVWFCILKIAVYDTNKFR